VDENDDEIFVEEIEYFGHSFGNDEWKMTQNIVVDAHGQFIGKK
jgi:hypothetical protein